LSGVNGDRLLFFVLTKQLLFAGIAHRFSSASLTEEMNSLWLNVLPMRDRHAK
jgi:hypothetical protein